MNDNLLPEGYEWHPTNEPLRDFSLWYDEHPKGTLFSMRKWMPDLPHVYCVDYLVLKSVHSNRYGKPWPSDAHGLCGVIRLKG